MSKALIIGDTPDLKKQLSDGVFEEQHYIQYAGKAEEAMEKFRSLQPNIVLFDTRFQESERWDLLRRLKREAPNIPVLIVSALENFSNDLCIDEAGGYTIKDIHPCMIRKKIQEASIHSAEDRQSSDPRFTTRSTGGGKMLHIGHFSFDEIDEQKKVRHGYFSCIVDAPDPDAAAAKFASHILRLQKDEAAFSSFAKIYLEDLIQVSEVPDEPIVTRLQSSEGEFPISTSYSLPFTDKNGLSAFGLFSNVEQQESEEDETKIFHSKPVVSQRLCE